MFGYWRFQKPWPRKQIWIGCLNCSTASQFAFMERHLAVGFGDVFVLRDGEQIYSEIEHRRSQEDNWRAKLYYKLKLHYRLHRLAMLYLRMLGWQEEYPTVGYIEKQALVDPDHDWRIEFYGPMHGETYQRQGVGLWVCIASNEGFA